MHVKAAITTRSNTLPGVSFPIDDAAISELIKMAAKEVAYVQLVKLSFLLHFKFLNCKVFTMLQALKFDLLLFTERSSMIKVMNKIIMIQSKLLFPDDVIF